MSQESWFTKAKAAASVAAAITTSMVQAGVESSKKAYHEMKAPPSEVKCPQDGTVLTVPISLFEWKCSQGHNNTHTDQQCHVCSEAINQSAYDKQPRSVVCSACSAQVVVPTSNASKAFNSAVTTTKHAANTAATTVKEQYTYLKATPSTFHCSKCNSLLAVPQGNWACQTCTAENDEAAAACSKCFQKKSDQKAICGVCHQSVNIPTSNLVDGVSATFRDLAQSSKKIYYDIANRPYLTCQRCSCNIPIDPQTIAKTNNNGADTNLNAALEKDENLNGVSTANLPPPALQVNHFQGVVCPSCKNPVEQ